MVSERVLEEGRKRKGKLQDKEGKRQKIEVNHGSPFSNMIVARSAEQHQLTENVKIINPNVCKLNNEQLSPIYKSTTVKETFKHMHHLKLVLGVQMWQLNLLTFKLRRQIEESQDEEDQFNGKDFFEKSLNLFKWDKGEKFEDNDVNKFIVSQVVKEEPHAYKMISSSPSPKLKEFCLKDEEKFCMEKGTYKKRKYGHSVAESCFDMVDLTGSKQDWSSIDEKLVKKLVDLTKDEKDDSDEEVG